MAIPYTEFYSDEIAEAAATVTAAFTEAVKHSDGDKALLIRDMIRSTTRGADPDENAEMITALVALAARLIASLTPEAIRNFNKTNGNYGQ